jgi:hypothetical protein
LDFSKARILMLNEASSMIVSRALPSFVPSFSRNSAHFSISGTAAASDELSHYKVRPVTNICSRSRMRNLTSSSRSKPSPAGRQGEKAARAACKIIVSHNSRTFGGLYGCQEQFLGSSVAELPNSKVSFLSLLATLGSWQLGC